MRLPGRRSAQVLVVGAGPVGLFAALRLARAGVAVQLVEKEKRTKLHSYALALHSRSLRLLDEAGIAKTLLERGHRIDRVVFYDEKEPRATFHLNRLDSPWPFILVLSQSELEYTLLHELATLGVRPMWNHELMELQTETDRINVELGRIDDVTQGYPIMRMQRMRAGTVRLKSDYVIGADGFHSLVRRLARTEFTDRGKPQTFVVFEFLADSGVNSEVRVILNDGRSSVLWPMGENHYRWSLEVDGNEREVPATEEILSLIRQRAPWFNSTVSDVTWSTVVHFERRLVESYGHDRTWLAGDAAHVTGPVGAQSMNIGLREANDIAECLDGVLREQSPRTVLDEFGRRWHAEWHQLLSESISIQNDDPWLRSHARDIVSCLPASGDDLRELLGQAGMTLGHD